MTRPGTDVVLLDTPGTVSVPTDTGTWFVTGLTDRGPVGPVLVMSLSQFVTKFGDRQSYSVLYDCVEEYFREGGNRLYISRVVGPAASSGSLNLMDSGAAISLVATAIGPGAWSNTYKVAVYAVTGGFGIQVLDASNNVLEDSGALADQTSAINWSKGSNFIVLTKGASNNNPQVATATVMSAGADDRTNITDTQWQTALDKFTDSYGPGQVSAPGQTSTTRHSSLVAHAAASNRVALLDLIDSPTQATLTGNLPTYSSNTRFAAAFAPWLVIPGISGAAIRIVPPSPMIAGMIAANDPSLGVDSASAGKNGISNYAIDLSQPDWDDSTRQSLNSSGVNVIRRMLGSIRNYGWRGLANPVTDAGWLDFGNARLFTGLSAELQAVGENYVFENIDGQNGTTVNGFHDDLAGVLLTHYNNGDLFGDSPDQAFLVDTGPSVNTLQSIANLELHAVCQVRMSPFAEWIEIQIVKRQTSDTIATTA
jgi:hypothetical protein